MDDYRNNEFENAFNNVTSKKREVEKFIKYNHPRAKSMYSFVKQNDSVYKIRFMNAYNNKCSYCGLSSLLAPSLYFEIDHFIEKNNEIFKSRYEADSMNNIVLACHRCNHGKSDYIIPARLRDILFPDGETIKLVFKRDERFNIVISNEYKSDNDIKAFYDKLGLNHETHRLDYVLLYLIKLQERIQDPKLYQRIGKLVEILRKKRETL